MTKEKGRPIARSILIALLLLLLLATALGALAFFVNFRARQSSVPVHVGIEMAWEG